MFSVRAAAIVESCGCSLAGLLALAVIGCQPNPADPDMPVDRGSARINRLAPIATAGGGPIVAHLGSEEPDAISALESIKAHFVHNNPGYDLAYLSKVTAVDASHRARIAFVQEVSPDGATRVLTSRSERPSVVAAEATLSLADDQQARSQLTVGDLVVLRPGAVLRTLSPISLLVFGVPDVPPTSVPAVVRPDWDENITDTPGGCATEEGAYRRILLTWLEDNGPYTYHSLNAHRVRITDSFTHYHPLEGGFDEFYLVQMANDSSKILTSLEVPAIEAPDQFDSSRAVGLLHEQALEVGDLVYLPRGMAHRGLGGVLAQVITAPGFRPGAEIGLDHHLRSINERLGLEGEAALPFHQAASDGPLIR